VTRRVTQICVVLTVLLPAFLIAQGEDRRQLLERINVAYSSDQIELLDRLMPLAYAFPGDNENREFPPLTGLPVDKHGYLLTRLDQLDEEGLIMLRRAAELVRADVGLVNGIDSLFLLRVGLRDQIDTAYTDGNTALLERLMPLAYAFPGDNLDQEFPPLSGSPSDMHGYLMSRVEELGEDGLVMLAAVGIPGPEGWWSCFWEYLNLVDTCWFGHNLCTKVASTPEEFRECQTQLKACLDDAKQWLEDCQETPVPPE